MNVDVKLFAGVKQLVGQSAVLVALPDDATVGDLRHALVEKYPSLEPLLRRAMISVNLDYAHNRTIIPANAEVACIPPVSGG